MVKKRQSDFRFRFLALSNDLDYVLLSYLKSFEPASVGNELFLKAVRAFWLPIAYQESGLKTPPELKKIAQGMILLLEEQANLLRLTFGIERYSPVVALQMPLNPTAPSSGDGTATGLMEDSEDDDQDFWHQMAAQEFDTGGL